MGNNGRLLPPAAQTNCLGTTAGGSSAGTGTPSTCSGGLLAQARLGAPVFGTDVEPCGGCSRNSQLPASGSFHYVYNID